VARSCAGNRTFGLYLLYQANFNFKLATVNVLQGVLGLLILVTLLAIPATSGMPFVRRWTLIAVLFFIVASIAIFLIRSCLSIFLASSP
jgi:hypothetical protein